MGDVPYRALLHRGILQGRMMYPSCTTSQSLQIYCWKLRNAADAGCWCVVDAYLAMLSEEAHELDGSAVQRLAEAQYHD